MDGQDPSYHLSRVHVYSSVHGLVNEHPISTLQDVRTLAALAGCYEARRAAALSGVPLSTVYGWARHDVVAPADSTSKPKLWSYADLMALRVSWLRHQTADSDPVLPSPTVDVRQALGLLEGMGLDLWGEEVQSFPLQVDRQGRVHVAADDGQAIKGDVLDLLGPLAVGVVQGPDLRRPRPSLRIVPGKCSGEPHLAGSRITTATIASLAADDYNLEAIKRLYPGEPPEALVEAVELEAQLTGSTPVAV